MSNDSVRLTGITNTTPGSCVVHVMSCNAMWSLAQQFCYMRTMKELGYFRGRILDKAAIRARVIAATYARFYLEQEEESDPDKKGRFYWAALAAFASKTVACTLENTRVNAQAIFTGKVKTGLAKGNLWLFYDIGGWHRFYTHMGNCFDHCQNERSSENLNVELKAATEVMPWVKDALPKIGLFKVTPAVKAGFDLVKRFETMDAGGDRRVVQLRHLMQIAEHEQKNVLQPLIYDVNNPTSKDFVWWIQKQRGFLNAISPDLKIVFGSACETSDPKLESIAPKDTKLENYVSRMKWIESVAKQFHGLMLNRTHYMESELQTIASWISLKETEMTEDEMADWTKQRKTEEMTEDLMKRSGIPISPE
jgi:hypothetical protein